MACHREVADPFVGGGEVPARKDRICPGQDSADRTGLGAEKTLGAFRTQFPADPKFSPKPKQTVIAGGRMFKTMRHIAHKANQNEMLDTLLSDDASPSLYKVSTVLCEAEPDTVAPTAGTEC